MGYEHLELTTDGRRANVELARPDVMNAVNAELAIELCDCLREVDRDASIDVVTLTGRGDAFCSGYDLGELEDDVDGMTYRNFSRHMDGKRALQDLSRVMRASETVFVAVAEGYTLGIGFELSMIADVCIADADATFGFPETKVGLSITNGVTNLLPRVVGPQRAKLLTLTGERISGEEAARMGLIADAVPASELEERTETVVEAILDRAPTAISFMKELVNAGVEGEYDDSLERELNAGAELLQTEEYAEAISDFFDR